MEAKTISYWAYLNTTWTDISSYVQVNSRFDIYSSRGMQTNEVGDNLAKVGTFTFTVINTDGRFDPDSASPLSGWGKGTIIEMRVLYTQRTFKRFRGHIDSIKPVDVSIYDRYCTVTILDFMDYIYNMPFTAPLTQLNKTGDVAVNALIAKLPIQPQATSIQVGSYTYPAIFDTATSSTKMSTELEKVVNSEGSYFYVRCDPVYGETLVFENALARNGLVTARQLPETLPASKYLIDHLGRYLVDHLGRKLKANEACNCVLGDDINSHDKNNGAVINKATIRAFPKKTDTSNKVLYRLDSPMLLGSGETKIFKGRYTNPTESTSTQVNVVESSMSVTTKTLNTLIDGTGTDLSASFTATAVFYSSYPLWTVTNSSGYAGYITVLTASGYGIYQDNPVEFSVEDTLSQSGSATQNGYGVHEYKIDQQYQRDIAPGAQLVAGILDENKQPSTKWDKVTFIVSNDELMVAFLNVEIGDMIQITNSSLNTDSYFYIQGIEFTITSGEIITFSWILKKYVNITLGLSNVAVEFDGSNTDYVDFGYLPQASALNDKTLSVWVYLTAYIFGWGIGNMGLFGGCGLGFSTINPATSISENNFFTYIRATGWATTSGQWKATTTFNTNSWVHLLATVHPKDNTSNPVIYINGTSSSVTETEAPTGAYIGTEWNTRLGMEALYLSPTGKIKDARIYNRILTAAEALSIYNEGAYGTGVLSGLVFQAPCVRTNQLSYFTDKTLTAADKMIDNIYGAIGTPNGSPISRLP